MAKVSMDLLSEIFDAGESLDRALKNTGDLSVDDFHSLYVLRSELGILEKKLVARK